MTYQPVSVVLRAYHGPSPGVASAVTYDVDVYAGNDLVIRFEGVQPVARTWPDWSGVSIVPRTTTDNGEPIKTHGILFDGSYLMWWLSEVPETGPCQE